MKRCPVCRSTYADDSLRFCLQDGAALESASAGASADDFKTLVLPDSAGGGGGGNAQPTEILDLGTAETAASSRQPLPTTPHRPRDTNPVTAQPATKEPRTRSTASVVAVTIAATVALLALGGLTAWLLLRDKRDDGATNLSTKRETENQNNALPNGNTRTTVPNANATATPYATATPKPTPTSTPVMMGAAEEREVRAALNGWLNSFRAHDLDAYMARYAGELDAYYRARSVGVERVRNDKARAFAKYSTIEVWLSNVQVQVDSSGTRAVATFNKSWRFSGPGVDTYEGSGLNRFTFTKMGGQWLITGEEDVS
jgi:ketosteroid isomerase-like protein